MARTTFIARAPAGIAILVGILTVGSLVIVLARADVISESNAGSTVVDETYVQSPLMRVAAEVPAGARTTPHPMLLTLGGPVYCGQIRRLALRLRASLVCADYGRNGDTGKGTRALRREDWGDPTYLATAARLPDRLRADGVKISKLILVGVSYSGFANAELVATHPEMHPSALIIVDSYLDLGARFNALPPHHITRVEIRRALGGTPTARPAVYASRSPSGHLDGLATAIRGGMRLVVVWSVAPAERREFRGATCSKRANAVWLARLATELGSPIDGYVTRLRHAHALWDRGATLVALAGIGHAIKPLAAEHLQFHPRTPPPRRSYCRA